MAPFWGKFIPTLTTDNVKLYISFDPYYQFFLLFSNVFPWYMAGHHQGGWRRENGKGGQDLVLIPQGREGRAQHQLGKGQGLMQ